MTSAPLVCHQEHTQQGGLRLVDPVLGPPLPLRNPNRLIGAEQLADQLRDASRVLVQLFALQSPLNHDAPAQTEHRSQPRGPQQIVADDDARQRVALGDQGPVEQSRIQKHIPVVRDIQARRRTTQVLGALDVDPRRCPREQSGEQSEAESGLEFEFRARAVGGTERPLCLGAGDEPDEPLEPGLGHECRNGLGHGHVDGQAPRGGADPGPRTQWSRDQL